MRSLKPFFKRAENHNVLVFNILLWFSAYCILLFSFSENGNPKKIDLIYTSCFIATIIIPVLINLYVLVPHFLAKERYLLFGLFFLLNLLLFTQVNKWFFLFFIDFLFPDYYFISYHSNSTIFIIFSVFLIATTLIRLSENWIRLNKEKHRILALENIEIQNQLSLLKSQINPHFLFNSLNVLYSLALEKKKETPSAILQLSDILRYVLYETNKKHISLKDEIRLIRQYLKFQEFRSHHFSNISFELDIDDDSFLIQPMLLLPLIENSFKYGIQEEIDAPFINIKMTKDPKEFHFFIENNLPENVSDSSDKYSGLGLTNIQQNLELIYPNAHSFTTLKTAEVFKVSLKIIINEH